MKQNTEPPKTNNYTTKKYTQLKQLKHQQTNNTKSTTNKLKTLTKKQNDHIYICVYLYTHI